MRERPYKPFYLTCLLSIVTISACAVISFITKKQQTFLPRIQKSAHDIYAIQYDDNGGIIHTIKVSQVDQHEHDYKLANLDGTITARYGNWHVLSPNGIWHSSDDTLSLMNGVYATLIKDTERSIIQVPDIMIDTNRKIAESDSMLTVHNQDGNIEATGIIANLVNNDITLKSNITGQYTVQTKEKIDSHF